MDIFQSPPQHVAGIYLGFVTEWKLPRNQKLHLSCVIFVDMNLLSLSLVPGSPLLLHLLPRLLLGRFMLVIVWHAYRNSKEFLSYRFILVIVKHAYRIGSY